jgi:GntR family transcriptional regulator
MKLQENHIPLYLKLYWKLKDDIHFMELPPGERMPTVEELHKLYGLSQGTVLKTLDLLQKEGLITKKRGTGVSVRDDIRIKLRNPIETGEVQKSRILQFDIQILSEGWVTVTNRIRNLFNDQADAFRDNQIYQIQSLLTHKEDNRRKNYHIVFIPAWIMSLVGEENIRRTATEGLIQFNGIKTDRITAENRPWICNAEVGEVLGVSEGSAMFRRLFTHYSTDNRILACVESFPTANATIRELKLQW